MSGKRERHKQQTRQAILQAARQLFPQQGFDQTRIEDLAQLAGVGKGTIYSYFASKEQILIDLLADNRLQIMEQFQHHNNPKAPVIEQVMTLFLCQFDFCRQHRELTRIMFRESMFPALPSIDQRHQVDMAYIQAVVMVLSGAQQRGELAGDLDLLSVAIALHAHYCMTASGWYIGYYDDDQVAHNLRQLVSLTLRGCTGPDSPSLPAPQPLKIALLEPDHTEVL